jgi:hypothetical protein
VSSEKTGGLDTDQRLVQAPPPMRGGYLTERGSTRRNGMPITHPYAWNDGDEVAEPREIVRALHRQLGARYYDCCDHCGHDSGDPPHTVRCSGGCNDAQDGEQP